MRFNARELAAGAQEATVCSKEGYLHIKEKQEGIFRKNEIFVRRWCRLRGNLLFFFKSKNLSEDPVGLIVLERCTVELDPNEDKDNFSFQLVFENDSRIQYVCAKTESERDSWIEVLHISSYECLKMQLESLREQLSLKNGRDPLDNGYRNEDDDPLKTDDAKILEEGEPFLEVLINCVNLLPNGDAPTTMVSVYMITPPQEQWIKHSHTELVERHNNPTFCRTIQFGTSVKPTSRVKFAVHQFSDEKTSTPTLLGEAICTFQDIADSMETKLTLNLVSFNGDGQSGNICITAWTNTDSEIVEELSSALTVDELGLQRPPRKSSSVRRVDMLKPWFGNVITKSFAFDSKEATKLKCQEYLAESVISYTFPQQLLKLWIDEDTNCIQRLQDLGQLPPRWEEKRSSYLSSLMPYLAIYQQSFHHISQQKNTFFKPSAKKDEKELSFVPTNLHLHRFWVIDEKQNKYGYYDIFTVGAFTAISEKFKDGGLSKIIKQSDKSKNRLNKTNLDHANLAESINKTMDLMEEMMLLKQKLHFEFESLTRAALQCNRTELKNSVESIDLLGSQLVATSEKQEVFEAISILECSNCETKDIGDIVSASNRNNLRSHSSPALQLTDPKQRSSMFYINNRMSEQWEKLKTLPRSSLPASLVNLFPAVSEDESYGQEDSFLSTDSSVAESPCSSPRVSGNCDANVIPAGLDGVEFETKHKQPWDEVVTDLASSLVCASSKAQDLLFDVDNSTETNPNPSWFEELIPLINKVKPIMENMYARAVESLTLYLLNWYISYPLQVRYRRDIVAAQAITSVTSSLLIKLRSNVSNANFFKQILHAGILTDFESLLSCYGDELGMIEDFIVAVDDLDSVSFKVVCGKSEPSVIGSRSKYIVSIPVSDAVFASLPVEIQLGKPFSIVSVLFNVGINEKATLAENFGSTTLQDKLNLDSYNKLEAYFIQCNAIKTMEQSSHLQKAGELLKQLQVQVSSKKSKNAEILQLSSKICRLLNGMRFTSCKSAKDRTAMSVTLEELKILEDEYDLDPNCASHCLDSIRESGVRLCNTRKNTGSTKYAFNKVQLISFPKVYRPPHGTFSANVQT